MADYSAAIAKIANLCVQAYQELPERLIVEFPADSTLADTNPQAANNLAFLAGVLGMTEKDPKIAETAKAKGICAEYKLGDFACHPQYPATVKVSLEKGKKHYFFYAACTGEKNCLVYEFDRCPANFRGDCYDLLVFIEIWAADKKESMIQEISERLKGVKNVETSTNGTCWLMTFHCEKSADQVLIDELNALDHVQLAEQLVPIQL